MHQDLLFKLLFLAAPLLLLPLLLLLLLPPFLLLPLPLQLLQLHPLQVPLSHGQLAQMLAGVKGHLRRTRVYTKCFSENTPQLHIPLNRAL